MTIEVVCPKCNALSPVGDAFCSKCGTALDSAQVVRKTTKAPEEITYYSDPAILVTNTRTVVGFKTYAMANITSVSMGVRPANQSWGVLVLVMSAGGFLLSLLLAMLGGFEWGVSVLLLLGSLVGIGLGVVFIRLPKPSYMVRIGSASGEADILTSQDRDHIEKIVQSITRAIIERG